MGNIKIMICEKNQFHENAAICTSYGNMRQYDNRLICIRIIIILKMVAHCAAYFPISSEAFCSGHLAGKINKFNWLRIYWYLVKKVAPNVH